MDDTETFEEGQAFEKPDVPEGMDAFVVDLEGYEGPIDVLLSMARNQKVDITQISILALANQYLAFVEEVRARNLELAADYLVMAAWLAYLKSRLLLPDLGEQDEPTGAEMAAALQYQLRRLESMQEAGKKLMARPRLGIEFFANGQPETFRARVNTIYELTLFELLKAYGEQKQRKDGAGPLSIEAFEIYTVEDALVRLRRLLGPIPDWQNLWNFLPDGLKKGIVTRSAVASTFAASLEMAKEGRAVIKQAETFGPIHVRSKPKDGIPANDDGAVGNTET
jgi:segregation and condensation protein A